MSWRGTYSLQHAPERASFARTPKAATNAIAKRASVKLPMGSVLASHSFIPSHLSFYLFHTFVIIVVH